MPDADTAVLEPETIAEAPETGGPLEDPTTAADALENDDSEETPETEAAVPATEVATRIEAARQEALKEARAEASEAQEKATYQWRQNQAANLRNGEVQRRIASIAAWAHKEGETGNDLRLNPQVVEPLAKDIEGMVFQSEHDAYVRSAGAFLAQQYPAYRPSKDVMNGVERAARAGDPGSMVFSHHALMVEAIKSELEPKLRAEIAAELKTKTVATGKTQAIKDADATRRAGGSPTAAGDAGGSSRLNFRTQQQVDMALWKGDIDSNTARQWLSKGLPYQ